jgi:hypothetical protein
MSKSFNRNQDKYNKWERERQQRDSKKNKSKNNGQKKPLTSNTTWDSVNGDGNGSGDY